MGDLRRMYSSAFSAIPLPVRVLGSTACICLTMRFLWSILLFDGV